MSPLPYTNVYASMLTEKTHILRLEGENGALTNRFQVDNVARHSKLHNKSLNASFALLSYSTVPLKTFILTTIGEFDPEIICNVFKLKR